MKSKLIGIEVLADRPGIGGKGSPAGSRSRCTGRGSSTPEEWTISTVRTEPFLRRTNRTSPLPGLPPARRLLRVHPLVLDPPLELREVLGVARVGRVQRHGDLAVPLVSGLPAPGSLRARPATARTAAAPRRRRVEARPEERELPPGERRLGRLRGAAGGSRRRGSGCGRRRTSRGRRRRRLDAGPPAARGATGGAARGCRNRARGAGGSGGRAATTGGAGRRRCGRRRRHGRRRRPA